MYDVTGLAEVLGGMGLADLHKLMPSMISTTERVDIPSHVRDGYTMMYIYLPTVFKEDFMQYIGPIIPSILQVLPQLCYILALLWYKSSFNATKKVLVVFKNFFTMELPTR